MLGKTYGKGKGKVHKEKIYLNSVFGSKYFFMSKDECIGYITVRI